MQTVYYRMSPCCDLDLKNSKPIFLHDTLAHEDASQKGNKMFGSSYHIIWTNIEILTLCCNLALKCSDPILSQDTLAYEDVSSD